MEGSSFFAFLVGLVLGAIITCAFLFNRLKSADTSSSEYKSAVALLTDERANSAALTTRLQTQDSLLNEKKEELEGSKSEVRALNEKVFELNTQVTKFTTLLTEERKTNHEKLALLTEAQTKFSEVFKILSADALKSNNESFITLAKSQMETFQQSAKHDLELRQKSIDELVKPLKDGLENVDKKIQELDKARTETAATLNEQIKNLVGVQTSLQSETQNLARALRTPGTRGRWGELQLRRVVEMAGMLEHCDFNEQVSVTTESGRLRPDMTVQLPGNKRVVVDSKVPLEGYLNALETNDEILRQKFLEDHARQVKTHLSKLGEKGYWEQFEQSPEFVILFLPGEPFFGAALEKEPELIEFGVRQKVIIATPTTLIALLRAVAYGWTSERLSENAETISLLGRDLYDKIRVFTNHFAIMGRGIEKTVESYNKAVGSLERNVLTKARKFKELAAANDQEIDLIEPIEVTPRQVIATEATPLIETRDEN